MAKSKNGPSPLVFPLWMQQINEMVVRRRRGGPLLSRQEDEELLAQARKTGEIRFGPEWDLIVAPRDMAAARDLLPVVIRAAYRASILYKGGREREGAKAALEAVLILFQSISGFMHGDGDVPLRALLRALEGLGRGAVEPMLQPMNLTGSRRSLRFVLVCGHAAAIAELMHRSGHPIRGSCGLVADRLHAAGYRLTAEDQGEARPRRARLRPISRSTIMGWRRRALESPAGDPIRDVFDRVCSFGFVNFEEPKFWVEALISDLQSYVRPDHVTRARDV